MSGLEMKYFILKPQSKAIGDPYAKGKLPGYENLML